MTSLHRSLCCAATLLALVLPAAASADEQARVWHEQALAHEHGTGVGRNMDTALELYCKAALAGDVRALYRMGWIYTNGRGVERNDAFAAHLFQQAAGLGDEVSRNMLRLVGSQTAKPPCTVQAEAAEAQRRAELQAAAEQAASETAAQAAQEEANNRYKTLINSAHKKDIMAIVRRLAPQYGIHPGLAFAVIRAESNFDPLAISDKNAQGLMQLIPETAARFNVRQPLDPEQNIRGGLAYLRWLLAYFKGDVPLAVAAYNAGEGTVNRYGGVPPFKETQGYLRRIQEVFSLPEHPFDPRITAPSPMLSKPPAPPRL